MSTDQSDFDLLPIYKLFFDDMEEIFLSTISFRCLCILGLITCLFSIGVLILILYQSESIFLTCVSPFVCALICYDFAEFISIILLKYNVTETNSTQLCRWSYYLKSLSESGQCLALVFIFILSRHQIQHFITHNQLSNSTFTHSCSLAFISLLFIVYINNWITHLKAEKVHLITFNRIKYEINIQELQISLHDIAEIKIHSYQHFINDLEKYAQGYEKNRSIENRYKFRKKKIIHDYNDGTIHKIIIKFPYDYLLDPIKNPTKRKIKQIQFQRKLNQTTNENELENNNSYRITRCTYEQRNFFLTNFLLLMHSITYFILISYFLTTICTYKTVNTIIICRRQPYEKSLSAECHKQFILLTQLKQFLYFILFSHTSFTLIRLIYIFLLTITLCLVSTPFTWLPIKTFFHFLFYISYLSIPLRTGLLFIYCFLRQFSTHLQSIIFHVLHTNLSFSWKVQKPTIRCRLKLISQTVDSSRNEHTSNSFAINLPSLTPGDFSDSPSQV